MLGIFQASHLRKDIGHTQDQNVPKDATKMFRIQQQQLYCFSQDWPTPLLSTKGLMEEVD